VPPFPNASKCSTSGEFHINGQGGPGHCTPVKLGGGNATPAATVNWGEFKGLYR